MRTVPKRGRASTIAAKKTIVKACLTCKMTNPIKIIVAEIQMSMSCPFTYPTIAFLKCTDRDILYSRIDFGRYRLTIFFKAYQSFVIKNVATVIKIRIVTERGITVKNAGMFKKKHINME